MSNERPIKLSPKKGGHGHVTSYSVNLGSAEVRQVGFLTDSGEPCRLVKIIDEDRQCIIIRKADEA